MLAEKFKNHTPPSSRSILTRCEIRSSDFVLFVALLFSLSAFFSILLAQLASWLVATPSDEEPPLLIALAANFGMQLGMAAAFLAFHGFIQKQGQQTTPKPPRSPRLAIKIGLKWLLIAYPIMIAVNLLSRTLLNLAGFEQVVQDPILMVQEGGTTVELLIVYSMIVFVAPLCEELAFRGGIFRFLYQRLPLYGSVGLSALLFALLHANLYSFAPLMTIGVMLALAYRESGSLLSCIVFHAVFNSINLGLILLFPDLT